MAPAKCGRAGARQLAVLSRSEGATAASDTLFEVVCSELDAAGYLPCYFKAKASVAACLHVGLSHRLVMS